MKHLFYIILSIGLLSSCTESPEFVKFSQEDWKVDNLGCDGLRKNEVLHLKEIKDAIQGIGERNVIDILGRPNRHVLGKRMKKNYFYFVESKCENLTSTPLSWLKVKFNSVSQVEEVVYKTASDDDF